MASAWVAEALAFIGLVIGAESYFLLIRRRQRDRAEAEARDLEESRRRAAMRYRKMERRRDLS